VSTWDAHSPPAVTGTSGSLDMSLLRSHGASSSSPRASGHLCPSDSIARSPSPIPVDDRPLWALPSDWPGFAGRRAGPSTSPLGRQWHRRRPAGAISRHSPCLPCFAPPPEGLQNARGAPARRGTASPRPGPPPPISDASQNPTVRSSRHPHSPLSPEMPVMRGRGTRSHGRDASSSGDPGMTLGDHPSSRHPSSPCPAERRCRRGRDDAGRMPARRTGLLQPSTDTLAATARSPAS
jgi:hypothetical protein